MATDTRPGIEALEVFLERHGIDHDVIEHPARGTAAGDARAAGIEPRAAAKTIVLCDGDELRVAVVPASERLSIRRLRDLLDAGASLRLATEDEIGAAFEQYEVGAIPPMAHLVPEVVDQRLLELDRILCSGGDHRHGVVLDPRDLVRVSGALVGDICDG